MRRVHLIAAMALAPAIAAGADFSGTWKLENDFNGKVSNIYCTLVQAGDTLAGSCKPDIAGMEASKLVGTAKGSTAKWGYDVTFRGKPARVDYEVALESDGSIAGNLLRNGSPSPIKGQRKLAQGPFSTMHMLLRKTFLKLGVLTLDVRVDQPTRQRLAGLVEGRQYSPRLAPQLGQTVMGAEHALIRMVFKRDVSLKRWISEVRDNLAQARKAKLISADVEQRIGANLPHSYASLQDRGYEEGDRLYYSVQPDAVHIILTDSEGKVLLERVDTEKEDRNVVLATYFAPGGDFREPLLRSLFAQRD